MSFKITSTIKRGIYLLIVLQIQFPSRDYVVNIKYAFKNFGKLDLDLKVSLQKQMPF